MNIIRKSSIQESGLCEGRGGKSCGSNTKHTAQIRALWGEGNLLPGQRDCHPPSGGTSHKVRQHCWSCRLPPWSPRDDSISFFSITNSAGSGQRKEGIAYREFPASPASPRRSVSSAPCPGVVGRTALAVQVRCTSPSLQPSSFTLVHPHQGISYLLWSASSWEQVSPDFLTNTLCP